MPDFRDLPDRGSEDSLRDLLDDAVATVEPAPALHRIQQRVRDGAGTAGPRPWLYATGAAVLATAATLTAVFVLGPDPSAPRTTGPAASTTAPAPAPTDGSSAPDGGSPTQEPTQEPTPEPTQEPTPGTSAPAGGTIAALPVYYVADTPTGPRLFREFHRDEVAGGGAPDLTRAAVTEATGGSPLDPDYRTDWPEGTSAVAATLSGPGSSTGSGSRERWAGAAH